MAPGGLSGNKEVGGGASPAAGRGGTNAPLPGPPWPPMAAPPPPPFMIAPARRAVVSLAACFGWGVVGGSLVCRPGGLFRRTLLAGVIHVVISGEDNLGYSRHGRAANLVEHMFLYRRHGIFREGGARAVRRVAFAEKLQQNCCVWLAFQIYCGALGVLQYSRGGYVEKGGDFVEKPVEKRHRQAKWDKRNLRTVSTHLTVNEAFELKRICRLAGIRPYRLLRRYLLRIIENGDVGA